MHPPYRRIIDIHGEEIRQKLMIWLSLQSISRVIVVFIQPRR